MTKILVLGGASKAKGIFEDARSRDIRTILCDQNPDAPCRPLAHRFHQVSTTEVAALADVAVRERVHGVVSWESDLMAVMAAQVAERAGLPGNPVEGVRALADKARFRRLLHESGLPAPAFGAFHDLRELNEKLHRFRLPVIVKPADGAGSTGVARVDDWAGVDRAFLEAATVSPTRRVVVEEYLERAHPHMIGGDVFVSGGEVVFWGLLNSHRSLVDRPFLPTGTSHPVDLDRDRVREVQERIQQVVTAAGVRYGGLNVELMYHPDGTLHVIEIAPRNGGNRIHELLRRTTGFNLVGALVEASLGRPVAPPTALAGGQHAPQTAAFMLHAPREGHFKAVTVAEELNPFVEEVVLDVEPGAEVHPFDRANRAVGTIFLRFRTGEERDDLLGRIHELVTVSLE